LQQGKNLFKKLNIQHTLKYQGEVDNSISFGRFENGKYKGYRSMPVESNNIINMMKSIIPEQYRHNFSVELIQITGGYLPPHEDANITVAINFYIETADGVTTFYKPKIGVSPKKEFLINQKTGFVYDPIDLDKVSSFKAEVGDVYLLDVKSIHSVDSDENKTRRAYALMSTEYNYNQTLNILKESGVV
jgi:hypothetical protein